MTEKKAQEENVFHINRVTLVTLETDLHTNGISVLL